MRCIIVAMLIGACAAEARAQQGAPFPPPIMLQPTPPAPGDPDRCVEVEIGSSRSFDCINRKLRQQVDRVNPSINLPPIDARSPDTKVGTVNVPAVQQQYGRNFGVSAFPYRPPPPVYLSPYGRR